jgi:hypothetical protein
LNRSCRLILAALLLAASPASAQVSAGGGFHLFAAEEESRALLEPAQPREFSLHVGEFPGIAPAAAATVRLPSSLWPESEGGAAGSAPKKKHFWAAVGEVQFFNLLPWAGNRYIRKSEFAFVSPATWSANIHHNWVYDRDSFTTNQFLHPYHGNLYFNAARVNGYNFWESMPFAAGGSLFWEYFLENEPVDYPDIVSTTVGGIVYGEAFFRMTRMIQDNTASGGERFLRELAAGIVNPVSLFDRLLRGQTKRDFPNPDDRFPSSVALTVDAGWRRVVGGQVMHGDQAVVAVGLRYGDPFDGTQRRPFDFFETDFELQRPGSGTLTRFDTRGSLVMGEVGSSEALQHRIGLFLGYSYLNDQVQVYSGPDITWRLLTRVALTADAELRSEVGLGVVPLGALQTEYSNENQTLTGRIYDYGPAGNAEVRICLRRKNVDLLTLGYQAVWMLTTNGVSRHNAVQFARVEARVPIAGGLAAGGGWAWDQRISSYDIYATTRSSHTQWRAFGAWTFH